MEKLESEESCGSLKGNATVTNSELSPQNSPLSYPEGPAKADQLNQEEQQKLIELYLSILTSDFAELEESGQKVIVEKQGEMLLIGLPGVDKCHACTMLFRGSSCPACQSG